MFKLRYVSIFVRVNIKSKHKDANLEINSVTGYGATYSILV
jgi:hypothetical protein